MTEGDAWKLVLGFGHARKTVRLDAIDEMAIAMALAGADAWQSLPEGMRRVQTPRTKVITQLFAYEPRLAAGKSGRLHRVLWQDDGRCDEEIGREFSADDAQKHVMLLSWRYAGALSVVVAGPPADANIRTLIDPLLGSYSDRLQYQARVVPDSLAVREVTPEELLQEERSPRTLPFSFSPELALRALGWEHFPLSYTPRVIKLTRHPRPGSSQWHYRRPRMVEQFVEMGLDDARARTHAAHIYEDNPRGGERLLGLLGLLVGARFLAGEPFLIIGSRDGERVLVPHHEETVAQLVGICRAAGGDPLDWLQVGRLRSA